MSSNTATATEVPQAPAHGAQGGDEGEKLRGTDFTYKRKKSLKLVGTSCELQMQIVVE